MAAKSLPGSEPSQTEQLFGPLPARCLTFQDKRGWWKYFVTRLTPSGFAILGFKVRLSLDLPTDKNMVMMETPNGSKEDAGHPQLISWHVVTCHDISLRHQLERKCENTNATVDHAKHGGMETYANYATYRKHRAKENGTASCSHKSCEPWVSLPKVWFRSGWTMKDPKVHLAKTSGVPCGIGKHACLILHWTGGIRVSEFWQFDDHRHPKHCLSQRIVKLEHGDEHAVQG